MKARSTRVAVAVACVAAAGLLQRDTLLIAQTTCGFTARWKP
jgi:hypothetical protein